MQKKTLCQRGLLCLKEHGFFWCAKQRVGLLKEKLGNLYKYGTFDMFNNRICIETITACNRKCYYCPNSIYDRGLIKNLKKMDTDLFYKIIDELAELKWNGEVAPIRYGEPLLDDRMPVLIKYTRDKLPNSRIHLYTNGDLLTVDLYKKLIRAGVNVFAVTKHPGGEHENVEKVILYRSSYGNNGVEVRYDTLTNIFNRGGMVEVSEEIDKTDRCRDQLQQVIVDYAGNIVFCCNDYFTSLELGNIRTEKLIDIWKKPFYKQLRKDIKNGIYKLDICKKCKVGRPLSLSKDGVAD